MAGTVAAGDAVTVRLTSADSYFTNAKLTLNIGGVSDTFSITTIHSIGDIDDNGALDLADAILILRVLAGMPPDNVHVGADVNGDSRLGLPEISYILQRLSGLREENPDDWDSDGISNAVDNCPNHYNPDQADLDSDHIGDACDLCPDQSNLGDVVCRVAVYDVKTGIVPPGTRVELAGVVTAAAGTSFFLQMPEEDHDPEIGYAFSGIFVSVLADNPAGLTIPSRGDWVNVTGMVIDFFGEIQFREVSDIDIAASGRALPAAQVVDPSQAAGGLSANGYEAVLVKVLDAEVAAVNPPLGEYVLLGGLRVNDFMYMTAPFPVVGDRYTVTGVLRYANENFRLEPRDAGDVVKNGP